MSKNVAAALSYEEGVSTSRSIAESMEETREGTELRRSSTPEKYTQIENAAVSNQQG